MKRSVLQRLPVHLQAPKRLYMGGINLLCVVAGAFAAVVSPIAAVRTQCWILTGLLTVLFVLFIRGLSLSKMMHYGSMICVIHVAVVASLGHAIYSTVQVWLVLLCVTQFYVSGARAGLIWSLVSVISLLVPMAYGQWLSGQPLKDFTLSQAPVSAADHLLVSLSCLLVPWIYKHRYEQALDAIRQRQQALQTQQQALEHTLQMREHFIASVSHELRTPMNAILGLNALLLERVQQRPQACKVLEYTRQSADHLMTVINDVLDYSQMSGGQLRANEEVFELAATVRAAFELFRPQVENTALTYHCRIDADVPRWVRTDRHRLMQVLVNLLGNAIKFTHQGTVRLHVQREGGGVEFAVQDTGIGLSEQQQQRIFQRYRQADERIQAQYGGSGLGLTISQGLVQMLGGEMGLHSQPGRGSRFWVWLPLQAVPAPAEAAPVESRASADPPSGLRFLVVDDHPVNRLLARQSLLRYWPAAQVDECENGMQALQRLQAGHRYDLVLMDMVMPVMDGVEATRSIRASPEAPVRSTPVLGLTANVSPHDLERFRQAGLNALMLKPFDLPQLRTEIERLVHGALAAAANPAC